MLFVSNAYAQAASVGEPNPMITYVLFALVWLIILIIVYRVFFQAKQKEGQYICQNPNCDFNGNIIPKKEGSGIFWFFLSVLGMLPGVFYAITQFHLVWKCPKCTMELGRVKNGGMFVFINIFLSVMILLQLLNS
jgi:hypothetical protein